MKNGYTKQIPELQKRVSIHQIFIFRLLYKIITLIKKVPAKYELKQTIKQQALVMHVLPSTFS